MMNKKKDYKIVEEQHGYQTKYVVKKRVLWFFWTTIMNNAGFKMSFDTKRGAQAYINFQK
jgi:hypothetical protein